MPVMVLWIGDLDFFLFFGWKRYLEKNPCNILPSGLDADIGVYIQDKNAVNFYHVTFTWKWKKYSLGNFRRYIVFISLRLMNCTLKVQQYSSKNKPGAKNIIGNSFLVKFVKSVVKSRYELPDQQLPWIRPAGTFYPVKIESRRKIIPLNRNRMTLEKLRDPHFTHDVCNQ